MTGWLNMLDIEAFADLEDSSLPDRVIGIIAAAILDQRLSECILESIHKDRDIETEMTKGKGPFGNFNTKIRLGFLLGIYSEQMKKDLFIIQDIRNSFAHSHHRQDFNSEAIVRLIGKLTTIQRLKRDDGSLGGGPTLLNFILSQSTWTVPTDNRSTFVTTVKLLNNAIGPHRPSPQPTPEF